ncbi:MAG: hypothetical protein LBN98_05595 [Prevotellaceae bacterium]|jgi:hypothetical protein|nr:hypothetical protein [Prevotellaceae bacterium]
MKPSFIITLLVACGWLCPAVAGYGCTSAIFTGKVTADGRPLLWKHRDTDDMNNRMAFFHTGKYAFLALLNSSDTGATAWTGSNSAGFSIMNTASYNLKDDEVEEMDREGELMYKALSECSTLAEFEAFLDRYPRPMRVEANFGVIDAQGGAAYYEVNNTRWVKVDVNDPKIAPDGFLVYTNFSYTGRFGEGMGYIRYQTAMEIILPRAPLRNITPRWIFRHLSRSFRHSLMGIDLLDGRFSPLNASGWVYDQDFIPRKSSSASLVIQGVKPGEHPEMTTIWTVLGYPPAGVAVPMWVKAGEEQPAMLCKGAAPNHARLCDHALALKRKVFPLTRANEKKYIYFPALYNQSGTGIMQQVEHVEAALFDRYHNPMEKWRKTGINIAELKQLNAATEELLLSEYFTIGAE